MLSIIVCSRYKKPQTEFLKNIKETVGIEYEIVSIDNSENKYSIFSAYNEGFIRSKYSYLCFVHEDVFFHTHNWGKIVIDHLHDPKTGILGLAGGDLAARVPSAWWAMNPTEYLIQTDTEGKIPTEHIRIPENFNQAKRSVVLLDGVFLCMRRELLLKIKFDESLSGFHGYDYDIAIQSILAGYYNYVVFDVLVQHYSIGSLNKTYYQNILKIFKKWEKYLPIVEYSITLKDRERFIPIIEQRSLYKLTKRLARTGFPTNEIVNILTYYTKLVGSQRNIHRLKFLRLSIFYIRINSFIRNKK